MKGKEKNDGNHNNLKEISLKQYFNDYGINSDLHELKKWLVIFSRKVFWNFDWAQLHSWLTCGINF